MILVLSPHLDDAVISCGGLIATEAARTRVVVATLFSHGGDTHVFRREEDRNAVASLGAEAVHLGLLDAPERRGHPPSFRSLVLDDADDSVRATECVDRLVREERPERILFPLGAGFHIDHRITASIAKHYPHAELYEDRPYAFIDGTIAAALSALGANAPAPPDTIRRTIAAEPFMDTFLPADVALRADCINAFVAMLSVRATPTRVLSPTRRTFSDAIVERVSRAAAMYRSQASVVASIVRHPYFETTFTEGSPSVSPLQ